MASFTAGTSFTDGVANDVTAAKLGALVSNATPTSGFIQDRTAETVIATNDTFLIGDASDSNNLKRMTVANVMKAELTGTINTTAGTITTGVIPTLTSTTKITSGTGTAAAPAISPTGDTNTGIFFPTADTIAFAEGGTEGMRIDSSGNVGVGVTPSGWGASEYKAIQVGIGGSISGRVAGGDQDKVNVAANIYNDGTVFKYIASDEATIYQQTGGIHTFSNATSGTAGSTATFTERLRIDSSGNVGIGDNSPAAKLDVNGSFNATSGTIPTLVATTLLTTGTGTAAAPAIVPTGDTNTGFFFPAADTIAFSEGGAEVMRITAGGSVGIGTASPTEKLDVDGTINATSLTIGTGTAATPAIYPATDTNTGIFFPAANTLAATTNGTERLRIDSSGIVLIGKTTSAFTTAGVLLDKTGNEFVVSGSQCMGLNRLASDGALIAFYQDNTIEGTISVSGNTVSYNPFAGSHWSQLEDGSKPEILRGTVIESINQLCHWPDGGNERFAKCKISDSVASKKVYGVFLDWDNDWTETNDLYITSVGLFICRINSSVIVQMGDLLESNGDGTARVQADDVIRSSTIGKVTSSVKTHEYQDGSYCVPTVLYCG